MPNAGGRGVSGQDERDFEEERYNEALMREECDHPPLPIDERRVVQALADLARLEQRGDYEPSPVLLGPYTAYVLIAVLQLAWRHPDLTAHHKQIIEQIARPLSKLFGPPLSDSIELGWNQIYDVGAPVDDGWVGVPE